MHSYIQFPARKVSPIHTDSDVKKEKRKGALSVRPKSPSNKEREVGVIMYKNLLSRSAEFHWDDLIG